MFRFFIPRDGLHNTAPRVPRPAHPDEMVMDAQTYRDLEVFEADGDAASVYDLCNGTRTAGGAKALKARMRSPWATLGRIRGVQESLGFLLEHRQAFALLPGDAVIADVQRYLYGGLPLVASENRLEFLLGALDVRFSEVRRYQLISRGVHWTTQLLHSLRRMVAQLEGCEGRGEVGPWLEEMRTLMKLPAWSMLPKEWKSGYLPVWRVMSIDRMIRQHERATIERLLTLIFEVDALLAMADTGRQYGFVMPEIQDGSLHVVADGLFHPFVKGAVSNPLHIDQERRLLFLTGPNMAGKTTYLRACGTALYLAHLGMGVPARSFRFSPCERLFSAITIHDDVRHGVSFFRAEALRVKAIAQAVADGRRVIAIIDEPFKGTNVKDALDASRAILERFSASDESMFLVSSHLIELGDAMIATRRADLRHFEAGESEGRLQFDYILRPGISDQRLGVRVLREEGIFDLLDGDPERRRGKGLGSANGHRPAGS